MATLQSGATISSSPKASTSPITGKPNTAVPIVRHPQLHGYVVECTETKIQYLDFDPSPAELEKIYDIDYNSMYGRDFQAGVPEFSARRADAQVDFIQRLITVSGPVAEVGGGWGSLSEKLGATCYEYDSESVNFMKSRGIDARHGSLEADDHAGPFDLIVSSHSLEHIPKPREAVKAWRSKLKPKGHVFIEVPIENPVPHSWWGTDPTHPYWVGHLTFFGKGHLEQVLDVAGFDIVKTGYYDHPVSAGFVSTGQPPYKVHDFPVALDTTESLVARPKIQRTLAVSR